MKWTKQIGVYKKAYRAQYTRQLSRDNGSVSLLSHSSSVTTAVQGVNHSSQKAGSDRRLLLRRGRDHSMVSEHLSSSFSGSNQRPQLLSVNHDSDIEEKEDYPGDVEKLMSDKDDSGEVRHSLDIFHI